MSNIRTLRDLEAQPQPQPQRNTAALPNPWNQPRTAGGATPTQGGAAYGYDRNMEYDDPRAAPRQQTIATPRTGFWSWNLGEIQPQWYHMLALSCCPCFVGNPCSPQRKGDYKRMLKTFIFWISILQIIYFIVELAVGGVVDPAINPSLGPSSYALQVLGAKDPSLMRYRFEMWRFVTPIILHAGFIHIFFNLFVQIMTGLWYESEWGTIKMVAIYLLSGIGGVVMSCLCSPDTMSVGASGAILGMIGARTAYIITRWGKGPVQSSAMELIQLGIVLLITFSFSFTKYVDWAGHLGGFIVGVLMAFALFHDEFTGPVAKKVSLAVSLVLLVIFFALGFALFYTVVTPSLPVN